MTGLLYACKDGEAHHLSSGKAVAKDHQCQDTTLPVAIANYLAMFPGVWALLPWTCLACSRGNDGIREHCHNTSCKDEETGSRAHALDTLLGKVGQELSLMYEEEVENPQLVSVRYLLEIIFSPHNHTYRGLLKEAFLIHVESEDPCACMTTLGLGKSSATTTPSETTPMASITTPAAPTLTETTPVAPSTSLEPLTPPSTNPASSHPLPIISSRATLTSPPLPCQDDIGLVTDDIMAIELDSLSPDPMEVDGLHMLSESQVPENTPDVSGKPSDSWAEEMEIQDREPTKPDTSSSSAHTLPPTTTPTLPDLQIILSFLAAWLDRQEISAKKCAI